MVNEDEKEEEEKPDSDAALSNIIISYKHTTTIQDGDI